MEGEQIDQQVDGPQIDVQAGVDVPVTGASGEVMRDAAGRFSGGGTAPEGVGAPLGNLSAVKTGTALDPRRLVLGSLPPQYVHAERLARQYRRQIEQAVIDQKGEVSLSDAHWIDAAAGHEAHASIMRQILRQKVETLQPGDVVRISESISRARESRNKCFDRLGLDLQSTDPWDALPRYAAWEAAGRAQNDDMTQQTKEDNP